MKKIYIGFYQDEILAVSNQKEYIEIYMTVIRKLKNREFTIQKRALDDNEAVCFYSDYIVEPYYSFVLPTIDISIIENDQYDLTENIRHLLNTLEVLSTLSAKSSKLDGFHSRLQTDIEFYKSTLQKNKIVKILDKNLAQSHPILNCTIDEYLHYRRVYREIRDMNHEFHSKLMID